VLIAVKFNDEVGLDAQEVDDVALNWVLASTFQIEELPVSKPRPEDAFGLALIDSQLTREIEKSL
jgi:hypothetical protein